MPTCAYAVHAEVNSYSLLKKANLQWTGPELNRRHVDFQCVNYFW